MLMNWGAESEGAVERNVSEWAGLGWRIEEEVEVEVDGVGRWRNCGARGEGGW